MGCFIQTHHSSQLTLLNEQEKRIRELMDKLHAFFFGCYEMGILVSLIGLQIPQLCQAIFLAKKTIIITFSQLYNFYNNKNRWVSYFFSKTSSLARNYTIFLLIIGKTTEKEWI